MNKAFVVAKWEYLEKVKSKAFIISLIVTPLIMVAMGILPSIFARQEEETTKVVGIIDLSGEIAGPFAQRMQDRYKLENDQPRYLIETVGLGRNIDVKDLKTRVDARVVADEIEGYVVVGADLMADTVIEYRSKNVGDFRTAGRMEETLRQILAEKRLIARGLDPSLLNELKFPLDLKPVKLSKTGEEESGGFEKIFFSAYIFLMMLFFLIFTSGQLLVRSVIEEKSNRIVEVLVSSCSPTELMAGKVLGLSGLGFTQIGFWAVIGTAVSLQFGLDLVRLDHALLLTIYFVLGYLFYAAVFIAFGSPLTTEQEAQQVNSYLVLVLIIPIVIALPAIQNPDALWLKIMTYIPFLTPTMMALRIPIQTPSLVEILATIALMIVSIYAAMWTAGRIFRIAILATGKRPSLAEVIRWIRTG
ncbi:MAG: ABC transporter permease [Bacteroidota bacterium]